MVYQALYRKWRPRTFSAVVGQSAITDTLKNAIITQKVSHAFLFAGPRGTGKTSCAKIFAKALNCLDLKDGEPCNKCVNCIAADNGSMPDIMEIDAASNNGVDEIREIRDKVKYAPTQGKYKVYIIDEVHMLSMGAFNALLKTLEEPPEHVVFILATTEIQKVPATIISRTQRYNFKRITKKDLVDRMKYILDQEKIPYEDEALDVIAQVADGGMRDALSILDQLLSYEKDKITYVDALKITGFASREQVEQLLITILQNDATKSMELIHQALNDGASSKNILDEIIELATKSLLATKAASEEVFLTEGFIDIIKNIPDERFFNVITLANDALNDLRYTNQQQIPLSVFIVKASNYQPQSVNTEITRPNDDHLKEQIVALQKQVSQLAKGMQQTPTNPDRTYHIDEMKSAKNDHVEKVEPKIQNISKPAQHKIKVNKEQVFEVLKHATKQDLQTMHDIWPDLQAKLGVSQKALLDILEPVAASNNKVIMSCKYVMWFEKANNDDTFLNSLTQNIELFAKHNYEVILISDSDWIKLRQEFVKNYKAELLAKKRGQLDAIKKVDNANDDHEQQEEIIQKAKDMFGDLAKIKD